MEIGTFGAIVERYYESSQHVVYYVIKVWHNLSKISWTLDKRYSHFDKFHKELFKKYTDIPSLPHKTLFRRYSNNFLNKRQQGINDFLRYILSNDKVIESDEIRIFFEFDQYVPRPRLIVPQLISLINTQKNPISVIIYKSMLFLCETDMKILRNSSGNISISINEEVNDTCNIGNVVLMHTYKNYVYTEQ